MIDSKGNGEVWYVSSTSGTGITIVTKTVRAINPVCKEMMDRFVGRGVVKV